MADIYREWFLSCRDILEQPEWCKLNTGWLLAILKQQNDEVIVPYSEIGTTLVDIADERGLDVIGLFGRGIGGHYRFYPDYSPDPAMGGYDALKQGIAKARERGKRIILYVNGQLLDQNGTRFWPDTGRFITAMKKDGTFLEEKWQKYKAAPARVFGRACPHCETWREIMLRQAREAAELGADGILYDQLAGSVPAFCYSPDHGHSVPAIVFENDRTDNMEYVRREMARTHPDFIVMTEGLIDSQLHAIGMFHGGGPAAGIPLGENLSQRFTGGAPMQYYPELFTYTFPEVVLTVRQHLPAHDKYSINFGLFYGFRNETELRYAADRNYMINGVVPTQDDYGPVLEVVNIPYIKQAGNPIEFNSYYKQALTFQKEHADLLMEGHILPHDGIRLESSGKVLANGFLSGSGEELGVMVWNLSDEPTTYKVAVSGWRQTGICSPEAEVLEGDSLSGKGLHMVLFTKE
jgi:hypothetical protein